MRSSSRGYLAALLASAALVAFLGLTGPRNANGQVFGPPMTVYGSITDENGELPPGIPVDAIIDGTVCGSGVTDFYGDGAGRVPVYFMDIVSGEQKPGCGGRGDIVRFKVGDRFANETITWDAGPAELLLTIGNATPIPVPTATPIPRETAAAPTPTIPPPTPTVAAPAPSASVSPSPTATATLTRTPTATATATPTLPGVLSTREAAGSGDGGGSTGDGGGFPVWAAVVIGVGAIVALGGGIGYVMARSRHEDEESLDEPIA